VVLQPLLQAANALSKAERITTMDNNKTGYEAILLRERDDGEVEIIIS